MIFFHHKLAFKPVDPLANGLGEEIEAERHEPEAIDLHEVYDMELANRWEAMVNEAHNDPDFEFMNNSDSTLY